MSSGGPPSVTALVPQLERLSDVKLIGLGGVGGIVARYLALYLSTLDRDLRLVLVDGDEFEPRNAQRMFFTSAGNKAAVIKSDLASGLAHSQLALVAVEEYVTPENLPRLVHEGDTVLLAVDNHATRKLVSDYCAELTDSCLISGGNDGVGPDSTGAVSRGTFANVQIQLREEGRELSPPLTAFHPEIADPADRLPTELSCTEAMLSVPQILWANLATASAMLNAFWLQACGALHYPELCLDIHDGVMRPVPLPSELDGVLRTGNTVPHTKPPTSR